MESVRLGLMPRKDLKSAKKNRERLKAALVRFLKAEGFFERFEAGPGEAVIQAAVGVARADPSEIVLINLEDLWLETRPQNVPGTSGG